jgi:hypothetical protein
LSFLLPSEGKDLVRGVTPQHASAKTRFPPTSDMAPSRLHQDPTPKRGGGKTPFPLGHHGSFATVAPIQDDIPDGTDARVRAMFAVGGKRVLTVASERPSIHQID